MNTLSLHELHRAEGACFGVVNGAEMVQHYGEVPAEHAALRSAVGLLDLSARSRVCVTGGDRLRYLNGQVTNNVKALGPGRGCYAALVTAKGKMESDLYVHCLADELLLDFEPGLTPRVVRRLEQYVVADDVTLVDIGAHFGLLSVQGPRAVEALESLRLARELPSGPLTSCGVDVQGIGEMVLVRHARFATDGFDLLAPVPGMELLFERLSSAVRTVGGGLCGWEAAEIARVEAGIPRFGQDMDETNIPLEAGLEASAVSYTKGCYIGQEVINRIHTMGQVSKSLRGLLLDASAPELPACGTRLTHDGKDVGYLTSVIHSPTLDAPIALGYVRKEVNAPGEVLSLNLAGHARAARITPLPFVPGRNP